MASLIFRRFTPKNKRCHNFLRTYAAAEFKRTYQTFLTETAIHERLEKTDLGCLTPLPSQAFAPVTQALKNLVANIPPSALLEKIEWKWKQAQAALNFQYLTESKKVNKIFDKISNAADILIDALEEQNSDSSSEAFRDLLGDTKLVEQATQAALSSAAKTLKDDKPVFVELAISLVTGIVSGGYGERTRARLLDPMSFFMDDQKYFLRALLVDLLFTCQNLKKSWHKPLTDETCTKAVAQFSAYFEESEKMGATRADQFYNLTFRKSSIPIDLDDLLNKIVCASYLERDSYIHLLEHLRPYFSPQDSFLEKAVELLVQKKEIDRALQLIPMICDKKMQKLAQSHIVAYSLALALTLPKLEPEHFSLAFIRNLSSCHKWVARVEEHFGKGSQEVSRIFESTLYQSLVEGRAIEPHTFTALYTPLSERVRIRLVQGVARVVTSKDSCDGALVKIQSIAKLISVAYERSLLFQEAFFAVEKRPCACSKASAFLKEISDPDVKRNTEEIREELSQRPGITFSDLLNSISS